MYKKCIKCESLWHVCAGPNLAIMSPPEMLDWLQHYIDYMGYTQQQIADAADVPKGTISRNLAKEAADVTDFKYDTIRRMITGLIRLAGYTGDIEKLMPCSDPDGEAAECMERLHASEKALKELQSKLDQFEANKKEIIDRYEEHKREYKEESNAKIAYLKTQGGRLRITAIIMTSLLILLLFVLVGLFIYDITHPGIGWF